MEHGHAGGNLPAEARGGGAGGEGSGDHSFDLAVCAGHLTGWQGVLTPPPSRPRHLPAAARRTPGFRTIQVYPKDLPRVAPAGLDRTNSGHHHLLIDTDLPAGPPQPSGPPLQIILLRF